MFFKVCTALIPNIPRLIGLIRTEARVGGGGNSPFGIKTFQVTSETPRWVPDAEDMFWLYFVPTNEAAQLVARHQFKNSVLNQGFSIAV